MLINYGILPGSHKDKTLENYEYSSTLQRRIIYEIIDSSKSYMLLGNTGIGKTHILVGLYKYLCTSGVYCNFIEWRNVLKEFNNQRYISALEVVGSICQGMDVIMIDDISRDASEFSIKLLQEIFIEINNTPQKRFIITANFDSKENLFGFLSAEGYLISRMEESLEYIVIKGEDKRIAE